MWFPPQRCVWCSAFLDGEDAVGVLLLDWFDTHGNLEVGAWRHLDTDACKAVLS